MKILPTF